MSAIDDEVLADEAVFYGKIHETVETGSTPESTVLPDDSGEGNDGWYVPSVDGGLVLALAGPIETESPCYGASGAVGYVYAPNGSQMDIREEPTLEAWAYLTATGTEIIINRGGDTTINYLSYGYRSTGGFGDRAVFVLGFEEGGFDLVSPALSYPAWHHIVGTRRLNRMSLYTDGCLAASRADLPAGPMTSVENVRWRFGYMTNLVFGAINRSAGLSHVALYDHRLSAERVFAHFQAGKSATQAPCPQPTGYRPDCNSVIVDVA